MTRRCLSLCPTTRLRYGWRQASYTIKLFIPNTYCPLFSSFTKICCSETHSCGSESSWVTVPNMQLSATKVRLFPAVCPPSEEVSGLRYAWRDWPCDFKACPVYSAGRTLPAPPFITRRYEAGEIMWEEKLQEELIKN